MKSCTRRPSPPPRRGLRNDDGSGYSRWSRNLGNCPNFNTGEEFMLTLGVMSLSAYPLMFFLVSKVSKRDLEEEQRIRDEKRKERKAKGGGPPIMNRDGF